jgi:hypothetical protein
MQSHPTSLSDSVTSERTVRASAHGFSAEPTGTVQFKSRRSSSQQFSSLLPGRSALGKSRVIAKEMERKDRSTCDMSQQHWVMLFMSAGAEAKRMPQTRDFWGVEDSAPGTRK